MNTISSFLTSDHRACDAEFANLENAVASQDWDDSQKQLEKFSTDLTHHFSMEETVMFPAFEEVTGMTQGPTMVMRMEHSQMRNILEDLKADIEKKDIQSFVSQNFKNLAGKRLVFSEIKNRNFFTE